MDEKKMYCQEEIFFENKLPLSVILPLYARLYSLTTAKKNSFHKVYTYKDLPGGLSSRVGVNT